MRSFPGFGAFVSVVCAAFGAVVLGSGCGAGGSGGRTVSEAPASLGPPTALPAVGGVFLPGEEMRFELSLRGILGGEAVVAVGQPGKVDGKRIVIVSSRVESAGVVAMFRRVRDEVSTHVHLDTGLPLRHQAHVIFGEKESFIATSFAGGANGAFDVEVRGKNRAGQAMQRTLRQAMPDDQAAFDPHTVVGALRAWEPEDGQHAYFFVLVGRHLWQNTVRLTGREKLRTRMGQFDALRIDGVAQRLTRGLREDRRKPQRTFTVWISADEGRLPLLVLGKTEFGDVKAELVDYRSPAALSAAR